MTSYDRNHRALARRLAREYTAILHDCWCADRWKVMLYVGGDMFAIGSECSERAAADRLRNDLSLALATLVEREIERSKK